MKKYRQVAVSGILWQPGIRLFLVGILVCLNSLLGLHIPVAAQSGAQILISTPEISQFPTISFTMEAYDNQGASITDLRQGDIQVLENDTPLPVTGLQKIQTGLQITLVINAGLIMQNHVNGVSNYDRIKGALTSWFLAQPKDTPNDFSLITSSGYQNTHLADPADWTRALDSYQPDFANSQPDLTSLNKALGLAADPTPKPNMKRIILFITPALNSSLLSSLPALSDRAAQLGVRVYVWMVAQSTASNPATAQSLTDLAAHTRGNFFLFTGAEDFPNMETYLQPLRSLYQVSYRSALRQSGSHTLVVAIKRENSQLKSEKKTFTLTVLPPNPIFLEPPSRVVRSLTGTNKTDEKAVLTPQNISIGMITEFPDGYKRSLKRSVLYVDGIQVAENLIPPFDKFAWDLEPYTSSGNHMLQVKVEDELGLTGASIEIPVEVQVEQPASGLGTRNRLIIAGAVGGSALVFAIVLVLAGRRLSPFRKRSLRKKGYYKDPVTQPVSIREDHTRPRRGVKPASKQQTQPIVNSAVPARLVRLGEDENPLPGEVISLIRPEITLGSDPKQSIAVLESTSVSPLHARLYKTGNGGFILADSGSIAGTWINYAPVSSQGAHLEHGDLVHIGRVAFRFELNPAPIVKQPQISPYEEE